jgi:integrase
MPQVLLDAAGRPRSPATVPGYHSGRSPRNKGQRYPADPPTVAEIVAVMRHAGTGVYGARLRALIVVLWRAGLRIHEALALGEADLDPRRGALLVRRGKGGRREVGMDDWGWEHLQPWLTARRPAGRSAAVHRHRPDPRTHMVPGRRPHRSTPGRRPRRCAPALRAAPTPPRARRRDGPRGRSADRDPAPARTHQPRDHLDIPTGHRQHRDHRHRPRPPPPDGPRRRNPPPLTAKAVEARPLR